MLKFPTPGAVKTRLALTLGDQRACELHRTLVGRTLAEAARFATRDNVTIEARVAGAPDDAAARAWLGDTVTIREQGKGDLGERMERAVCVAFDERSAEVVVIGGDCPQLTAEHLVAAFAALDRHDAIIGPAADGGYYLIGMRRSFPALFRGIRWGGSEVLAQTLGIARSLAVDVAQLETLHDVDVPADLPLWANTPAARRSGSGNVSVIIPACDEEAHLPATLAAAQRDAPHEIIMVDGGSSGRTVEIARAYDVIVLDAPRSRARQMNCGAALTSDRRWRQLGVFQTTLINTAIVLGYHFGMPLARLADCYRGESRSGMGINRPRRAPNPAMRPQAERSGGIMETTESIAGGCLCGAVRYEAARPYGISHCHCVDCRRASGAPFVTWASFRLEDFRFTRGTPRKLAWAGRSRSFCGDCGTPLTFVAGPDAGEVDVTVGSFDHPERVTPADHTWIEDRLPWISLADGLPAFPRKNPTHVRPPKQP